MKKLALTLCVVCFAIVAGNAQEKKNKDEKKESIRIEIKDDARPDIYIDGKKYDSEIIDLIDPDKIESMDVIKGEKAMEKYNAPNGVILIKSKKSKEKKVSIKSEGSTIKIRGSGGVDLDEPMIIIDGKEVKKGDLEKMDPNQIESIEVLKDKSALEKYKSESGVIIVTTKKGKKSKK